MQGFQKFLDSLEVPYQSHTKFEESIEEEGYSIEISENYDEMMELTEEIISNEEGDSEIKNAGITVNLSYGDMVLADVNPNIIYKLSVALGVDEILELVSAIADAVEKPRYSAIM